MSLFNFCFRHSSTIGLLYSVAVAMEKGFSNSNQNFDWWDRFRHDLLSDGKTQQKLEIILKMCIIGTSFVCGTAVICMFLLAMRKLFNYVADSKTVVVRCYP
ncbi:CASP-like protein [Caenorhabditis elegans]|uniref:CASP-like protein n=1 Tax=Caenorhabditis elegans TaxID=6239 RepID=B3WFW1_CAEEL|nr:CASP-like protein [Caenorhabditis elegans]CAQ76485.1 CASP-like protein [Caenorhabditis elegans]|eukprot:NP_001129781.1 Uncharacterized protein CELE_K04G2.12 [Caenorhabditis elegans]